MPLPLMFQKKHGAFPVAVPFKFHPFHLAGLKAHHRVIAGLAAVSGTNGVHQGRLSFLHPLPCNSASAREVGLVGKEYL